MSAEPELTGRQVHGGRLLLARVLAAVSAVGWAVLFFGLVDLMVVPIQDDRFYDAYLLETGWGLLFTVLVATPLLVVVVRPDSLVALRQLIVAAAAVAAAAVFTPQWWQLAPAAVLLVTAVLLADLSGQRLRPGRRSASRVGLLLGSLVLGAAVGAVVYAASMIRSSRAGLPDDVTWGLDHLPVQAALGLALAGSAALAACSEGPGRRVVGWTAGVSAVWLGGVSVVYPDHLGSLGQPGGLAAIVWGLVYAACIRRTGRATQIGL